MLLTAGGKGDATNERRHAVGVWALAAWAWKSGAPRHLPAVAFRLMILAGFSMLSVIALSVVLLVEHARADRAALERQLETLAGFASDSIDRKIASARALLATLSTSPALQSDDLVGFLNEALRIEKPAGAAILLTDPKGRQLINTLLPVGSPLPNSSALTWINDVQARGDLVAPDVSSAPEGQRYAFGLALPIMIDGLVKSILVVAIPAEALAKILNRQHLPSGWAAQICDRRGNTIVASPSSDAFAAEMPAGDGGTFMANVRGEPALAAFSRSPLSGWTVAVAAPQAMLDAPIRHSLIMMASGSGFILLLGIGASLLVANGISGPITRHLRKRDDELRELTQAVPAILVMATADGELEYANQMFYDVTGLDTASLHQVSWPTLLHPDDVESVRAIHRQPTAAGKPFKAEFRLRHSGGVYGWYAGRSSLVTNADEQIRWLIAAINIDNLKQAEQSLRDSNDKRGTILDSISECYFTVDSAGRLIEFNRHCAAWARQVGLDLDASVGRILRDAFPQELGNALWPKVDEAFRTGIASEFEMVSSLGTGAWMGFRIYTGSDCCSVFFRDISKRKVAELSLTAAQHMQQSTMDALSASVAILDARGIVVGVNEAWRRFIRDFQVPYDGIGAHYLAVREACKPRAPEAGRIAAGLDAVMCGNKVNFRIEYEWPDRSEPRWFQLRVSRFEHDRQSRLVLAHEDVTEIQRAAIALQKVTGSLLTSQEDERRRIARELHDSTAQHLVAAKMIADRLTDDIKGSDVAALASDIDGLLQRSLLEIRNLSYLLHPPLLDQIGLISALRSYVSGFSKRSGIAIELTLPPRPRRLKPPVETALFRVVQEALANIHRHSGSATAHIRLEIGADRAILEIEDGGRGIIEGEMSALPEDLRSVGVGIPGMLARVQQLGGVLTIRSGSGGTIVRVVVPLVKEAARNRAFNASRAQ